jgi:aryl carrier-like protein
MTNAALQSLLLAEIAEVAGRSVAVDENLIGGAIDSLAMVELVNLVERLAKERNKRVDLDGLLSEDVLTVEKIAEALR